MQDIGLLHPLFHGLKVIRETLIHGQTPGWVVLGPLLVWSVIGLALLPIPLVIMLAYAHRDYSIQISQRLTRKAILAAPACRMVESPTSMRRFARDG